MPLLFGLVIGFLVYTSIWAFVGPFVALLNFLVGRFFVASVLMALSLYSETIVWSDFHVGREEYKVLLTFGLVLEGVKWVVKLWQESRSEQRWEPVQTEGYGGGTEIEMSLENAAKFAANWKGDVIVNIVDDGPNIKDVTQRRKRLR